MAIAILATFKASSNNAQYKISGSHISCRSADMAGISRGSADPSAAPGRVFKPLDGWYIKSQCMRVKKGRKPKSFVSVGSYMKPKEGSLSSHCWEKRGFHTQAVHAHVSWIEFGDWQHSVSARKLSYRVTPSKADEHLNLLVHF